ncbi:MAG: CinA family protein [Candidatus Hodarchaeales archaeon]|jgi:PncC family amidohydrolase
MGQITKINFVKELKRIIGKPFEDAQPSFTMSYGLLHKYSRNNIIPLIRLKNVTIATVELTTCGLLSDLLTGGSGASHFFILGMTPYSNEMKIKLGIRRDELSFEGYGVVSPESAKDLSQRIRDYSGAKVGIAETGILTSSELGKRRTKKKAGEVFAAIAFDNEVLVKKLFVQRDLPRREMRQEIAFRVLQFLESVLKSSDFKIT